MYERAHHRQINRFGGLWLKWPGYGGWSLLGFFAGMGLPGLCGFIGIYLTVGPDAAMAQLAALKSLQQLERQPPQKGSRRVR